MLQHKTVGGMCKNSEDNFIFMKIDHPQNEKKKTTLKKNDSKIISWIYIFFMLNG